MSEPKKKDPEYGAPAVDQESRAYWEGCGRGELVLQRCRDCGTVQHRPRAICATCLSSGIEHFVASGRGTVYTYSVVRQNQMPAFREAVPYVVAYVQLEEGPQLLTNVVGCAPEAVSIGMPVRVDFVPTPGPRGEPLGVPRFVPA
ncbi:MAG: Zn-ribbon domain-containing OB-fold protein [Spirochaetaceae bacterium]|nr:Zn-ribbon domain-containing OB-fold protein [Myxococcales bacterium]MCB9724914.1 Zn-ribbon domain-containing OB-fold protein [Spirochaetaceae bacterium]